MVLVAILAILPFALQLPDAVMKTVYPLRYEATIREASAEKGLEPAFVAGCDLHGEPFQARRESHKDAYGLMQLLPEIGALHPRKSGIEATTATRRST